MKLKDFFFNILSPPKCVSCNKRLPLDSAALFCYQCSKTYKKNDGRLCNICGKPIHKNSDKTCATCKQERIYYIKNVSRYVYSGSVKTAVQNMKFKRRSWIAFEFGKALYKTVRDEYADIKFDMILYVPMTPLNELSRGFNQSYEMAAIISQNTGIPINTKILYKKPGTKTQSGLNAKDRRENVKNAFMVHNTHLLTDKTVLLVDDVFTTGATINECSKCLKKAGALAVYTATLTTVILE